jgi:two-component system CheB/CheR fusion protein
VATSRWELVVVDAKDPQGDAKAGSGPETVQPTAPTRDPDPSAGHATSPPVVGIGASAGGLDALKEFFGGVSAETGLAFVVIVHMQADQSTLMPDILQEVTDAEVRLATDGEMVVADHVYIVPPGRVGRMDGDRIRLDELGPDSLGRTVDAFLKSLAQESGSRGVAVILSGTGSDGSQGVREVKSRNGLVLVQDERSARFDGMPKSAVRTGAADFVLPSGDMPAKIIGVLEQHRALTRTSGTTSDDTDGLRKIFALLQSRLGHDFSAYKQSTLVRRITRRMGLNQIDSVGRYLCHLRDNPDEVDALFQDLLIGVTSFFRDPASFERLETEVLQPLLSSIGEESAVRVWVPGCSTGEEAYSIAMILWENIGQLPRRMRIQVFATDIDRLAIDTAREGVYPSNIEADVPPHRLRRHFTRTGDHWRVRKEIRDCLVFSVQDVLRDPPFSKLHLLSCRNLLIYLDTKAQKRLVPLFHYTLRPGGVLMLGSSETIGGDTALFEVLDGRWKIYRRRESLTELRPTVDFPVGYPGGGSVASGSSIPKIAGSKVDLQSTVQHLILEDVAPTCVLTEADGTMLFVEGKTGKYLEATSGPPSQNIVDLAREGLAIELSSALREARSGEERVTRLGIAVKTNGDRQTIDLHIRKLSDPKALAGKLLVVFRDVEPRFDASVVDGEGSERGATTSRQLDVLENELRALRDSHQTTVEELESSNEELKSMNEELQSSNEELQSTNEELESSKEELQSLNEELQTVNAELQSKVDELAAAQDDMRNLLDNIEIATIFVDNELCVKRFNAESQRIMNLILSDVGRPLAHVTSNVTSDAMLDEITIALKELSRRQRQVQTKDGSWFSMRVAPYRTLDNRIDGVVVTFANIDVQMSANAAITTAEAARERERAFAQNVIDTVRDMLLVVDEGMTVVSANRSFARAFKIDKTAVEGERLFTVQGGQWDVPALRAVVGRVLEEGTSFMDVEVEVRHPSGGSRTLVVSGTSIPPELDSAEGGPSRLALLSIVETDSAG